MYLVLLRHEMDDLPVKLCCTRSHAKEIAKNLDAMPTDQIRAVFKTDCSTPVNVVVVEFDDDGDPVAVLEAKVFGETAKS